jgi:hypothetical protein
MSTAEELLHQVHTVAERLRLARAAIPGGSHADSTRTAALQTELTALWTEIRAARVAAHTPVTLSRVRNSKWS